MGLALDEARVAAEQEEIPVGAIVVYRGDILGRGRNCREELNQATAHAEILALEEASRRLHSWRLKECALYVTLEPCIMCVGAILQARLPRLVFGCRDPKGGAVESLYRLCDDPRSNHRTAAVGGVLEKECREILIEFFARLRSKDGKAPRTATPA